jgi:hypothetical protein
MLGCSNDARRWATLLVCAVTVKSMGSGSNNIKSTLCSPPTLCPTNTLFSKQPNTPIALFNFLHVMMDGSQEDSLLYPIWDVRRFMNNRDVHKNASTSPCIVQYVSLVLIKTDIVGQFLIQRVKEFNRIKHECQRHSEIGKKERKKEQKLTRIQWKQTIYHKE